VLCCSVRRQAYFSTDSAYEITVSPSSGVLPPYGTEGQCATAFAWLVCRVISQGIIAFPLRMDELSKAPGDAAQCTPPLINMKTNIHTN
jgi:hypothetical protein